MKKILAVVLMATSLGAIASPKSCLFNYVESQGGHPRAEHNTDVPGWSDQENAPGTFEWHNQGPVMGYKIVAEALKIGDIDTDGPNHCHCTVTVSHFHDVGRAMDFTVKKGVCGRW